MRCNKRTCMSVAGLGLVVACLAAMARRKQHGGQGPAERPTMWDKMRKGMEEMPEDFPPRIMFDNVETTRANTQRILEILEGQGEAGPASGGEPPTSA